MSIQRNDWSLQRKGIIDQERHKERVKEAIKKNLGSIVSNEAIILSDGKRTVKVPIRALDEYKFRFDYRKKKHVGQGDGKTRVGDVIAREGQPGQQGQGGNQAGQTGGEEYYEAEINIDEIAALIFEDLQLPFLEEKAKKAVQSKTTRFNEIRRTGVMANLDKRRMILENIKRNAREEGKARFGDVRKEDLRFKTWEESLRYESNAVVLALMDVSGSMGEFKKYIARSFFFWMVRFLRTK
jgi:sporulation protein YhbH